MRRKMRMLLLSVTVLTALSLGACQNAQETVESEANVEEPVEVEEDAEEVEEIVYVDTYVEDENEYGNSAGNIFNDGLFICNANGAFYFNNYYDAEAWLTLPDDGGFSMTVVDMEFFYMNYMDGRLYGMRSDGAVIAYNESDMTTEILREGGEHGVKYMQLVNDTLYYTDDVDNTFWSMPAEGGEETLLLDEEVFYPVVYKDRIIFQRDGDKESLYSMTLDGGEITKLNDVASYYPLVYRDRIYYEALDDEDYSLRAMNLDGSEETILSEEHPSYLNLYSGCLYYVTEERAGVLFCLDLDDETAAPEEIDLTEQIAAALKDSYGDDALSSLEILYYQQINLYGNYMMFVCAENIDGSEYLDQYIYDMESDEIIVIPTFCQNMGGIMEYYLEKLESAGSESETGTADSESEEQEVSSGRTYPSGDYSVGSVYGPKLSQSQLDEVADAVTVFLQTYDTASMDDYTKILTAHDYLCNTCSYAADWSQNGANTAWGALIYHEAQCSGYARAMKALCDAMGVGCYYVHADENASNPSHQWNICSVNGNWYIVDVQCNDSSGFKAFFLVSDDTYANSTGMSWDRTSVPACPSNY